MKLPVIQLSSRTRALSVGGLLCVVLYGYLHFQYPSASFRRPVLFETQKGQILAEAKSKDDFVTAATRNALAFYNHSAVESFCAHDSWNSNVIINCDRIFGGIGNLRQVILACLHFAIVEGRGFIIPPIELRQSDDLIQLESNGDTGFEYIFDRELFISRLSAACPRMPLYNSLQEAEETGLEVYHFVTSMAHYVVCQDSSDFAINFGSLLVFQSNIYRLAHTALYTLRTSHEPISSIEPLGSSETLSSTPNYFGIHLRTAVDAVAMGWSSYEEQSERYLSLSTVLGYPFIYVATGNASSVSIFAASAAALDPPRAVITKDDLLFGADLAEMQSLTWDQAALIDYLILENAGFFAGLTESSFSWNIAAKRLAVASGAQGFCEEQMAQNTLPTDLVWRDKWSLIYGRDAEAFGRKIWP